MASVVISGRGAGGDLVFGVAGGIEKDVEAGAMVAGFGAVATTPFARGRTGLAAAGTFLRVAGRAGATAGLVAVAFMAAGLVAEDLEAMVYQSIRPRRDGWAA